MNRLVKKTKLHEDAIFSVCWESDYLITASVDESVKVVNPKEEKNDGVKYQFKEHELAVVSAVSDGNKVVTSSMDGNLRVFELESGKLGKTIACGPMETWTIDLHPIQKNVLM